MIPESVLVVGVTRCERTHLSIAPISLPFAVSSRAQSRDLLFARAGSMPHAHSRSLHSPLKRLGRDDNIGRRAGRYDPRPCAFKAGYSNSEVLPYLFYRQRATISVMSSACSPWLKRCTSATTRSSISPALSHCALFMTAISRSSPNSSASSAGAASEIPSV